MRIFTVEEKIPPHRFVIELFKWHGFLMIVFGLDFFRHQVSNSTLEMGLSLFEVCLFIFLFCYILALLISRFRGAGLSGWWVLALGVPILNFYLAYKLFLDPRSKRALISTAVFLVSVLTWIYYIQPQLVLRDLNSYCRIVTESVGQKPDYVKVESEVFKSLWLPQSRDSVHGFKKNRAEWLHEKARKVDLNWNCPALHTFYSKPSDP